MPGLFVYIVLWVIAGFAAGAVLMALPWLRTRVRFKALQGQHQWQQAEAEAQIQQLSEALADSRQQCLGLQSDNTVLSRQLGQLDASESGLRERLDELRTTLQQTVQQEKQAASQLVELEKQLASLTATHTEKIAAYEQLQTAFRQSGEHLKTEFTNLANRVLEEKGKVFASNSQASLEALLNPFKEQIMGFQQRVNQVHDATLKGNASLSTEIRQILEVGLKMSTEASNLASALKGDKKMTGGWGEAQLEQTLQLAGLVRGDHYEAQSRFSDGKGGYRHPDFIVKLPDGKHLVIDSKVSLVDYDRAVGAETEAERLAALDQHVKAVRHHIDDLSSKDYSNLTGMRSPGFVLMFMPIEAAYIEALKHNRELFDLGYKNNVVLVSHTTLMPILKTVANLWMMARSNEEAHQLSERAGDIYNQIVVVAEHLKRLGDALGTVGNHYNKTVTSLAGRQGLYGKAQRFAELSARANKTMPTLEPLHKDIEVERLDLISGPESTGTEDSSPLEG